MLQGKRLSEIRVILEAGCLAHARCPAMAGLYRLFQAGRRLFRLDRDEPGPDSRVFSFSLRCVFCAGLDTPVVLPHSRIGTLLERGVRVHSCEYLY